MNTQDLLNVLKSHRGILRVELQKDKDCNEFWSRLTDEVYYLLPDSLLDEQGNRLDAIFRDTMKEFATKDSLEIVNKQGKILKRLARFYKESNGHKLSDEWAGIVGDKLQYHLSQKASVYYIDFTDSINWRDGQFGKDSSCWWGTYSASVPTWESGGGWGLRFYADEDQNNNNGIGRTWVLPKDNMLMCFNSYGVERPIVSKVIKAIFKTHDIELHYKRVELNNSQNREIPYINEGTGFILYPDGMDESTLDDSYDVNMEVEQNENRYSCYGCGDSVHEDDTFSAEDEIWCESCYNDRFSDCDKCGETYRHDDLNDVHGHSRYGTLCEHCINKLDIMQCSDCEKYHVSYIVTEDTDNVFCENCQDKLNQCDSCNKYYENSESCEDCDDEESEDNTVSSEDWIEKDFILQELETITIKNGRYNNLTSKQITTTVYRHVNIAGLFIWYDDDSKSWSVTHENSCLAVWNGIEESYKAFEFLNCIGGLHNWNCDSNEIVNNRELCNAVMQIRNDIQ